MVHPDTPLSSIKGLGKVYMSQTICVCKGGTVACLCEHVAPLFRKADAEEAIVKWACECARNPRAGQKAENGYIVPEYNTRVARTLVETLVHATANREQFEKAKHRVVPSSAWLMTLNGVMKRMSRQEKIENVKSGTEEIIVDTAKPELKEKKKAFGKRPRAQKSDLKPSDRGIIKTTII
jgi:hypothetical protein